MQQVSESAAGLTPDVSPAHACGAHDSDNLPEFIEQHWSDYTAEQHDVGGLLYRRRMKQLATDGSRVFLDGAKVIGLNRSPITDPLYDERLGLDRLDAVLARCDFAVVCIDCYVQLKEQHSRREPRGRA